MDFEFTSRPSVKPAWARPDTGFSTPKKRACCSGLPHLYSSNEYKQDRSQRLIRLRRPLREAMCRNLARTMTFPSSSTRRP